jgi:hypothetical protein
VVPEHGNVYWSVYFGAGCHGSRELARAKAHARSLGYASGHMDPACNGELGLAATLPSCPEKEVYVVAAYFASEEEARTVAAALRGALWVGKVKTCCLD